MASSLYRRQSMAQLYEKLKAQDDEDDMTWLAQYNPDDGFDEPYVPPVPIPPSLSTVSSICPVSSYSSPSSISGPTFDIDSSDEFFDLDSDSDVDPRPFSPSAEGDASFGSPLFLEAHDLPTVTESSDPPYIPPIREFSASSAQSTSTPPRFESDPSPIPILPPLSITSRRSTRKLPGRHRSPVIHDLEDMYSDGDGNASEDEYIPTSTSGSKKRHRSAHAEPASSQKRGARGAPRKRVPHSPHPRNVQTAPGSASEPLLTKNNPWACPHCKWVQRNHRAPDLKRHIRTHTRLQRLTQWVCCGVPLSDAQHYKLPPDAEPYEWGGEVMIGGCCKEFSRRDALKRHLDNEHIHCVGNFAAFANMSEDD